MATADAIGDDKRVSLVLPTTAAFKGWANRLADSARLTRAAVVEHALIDYAKRVGFEELAPSRR